MTVVVMKVTVVVAMMVVSDSQVQVLSGVELSESWMKVLTG